MYTFVRPQMGLESMIQYSEGSNNPVQWIQFLRALDQPDLPGWPLITPIKVQLLKCDKCSVEFCSPINFRRHARIHRRSLKVKKEPNNLRDSLAEFWDKCSLEERKKVVSFDGIMLKKIPGSSVIEALDGALLEPGVWALPQAYLRAGSKLLDIVQARPLITLTSSQELLNILDDASEGTLLCTGTAEDVQNYVFHGEAANSLEFKNLVKAWFADKDAEALRCQKLLVEEEEASLKRQARLAEKKKQKKLRWEEQRIKEQLYASKQDTSVIASSADEHVFSEESIPSSSSDSGSSPGNCPTDLGTWVESILLESKKSEEHSGLQTEITDECADQRDTEPFKPSLDLNDRQSFDIDCLQESGLEMERASNAHSKQEVFEKSNADGALQNISNDVNSKHILASDDSVTDHQTEQDGNLKVVIGSIFIPLNSSSVPQLLRSSTDIKNEAHVEPTMLAPSASIEVLKAEAIFFGSVHVASNLRLPDSKFVLYQNWKSKTSTLHYSLQLKQKSFSLRDGSKQCLGTM